jgi:hypothetical protein
MPMNTGPGRFTAACFISCWAAAAKWPGSHGFRFKNKLLTLDATLIELCASVFDWAQYRRTKGAVKLHLLLDHHGLLPSFALITEGRVHESREARSLPNCRRLRRLLATWRIALIVRFAFNVERRRTSSPVAIASGVRGFVRASCRMMRKRSSSR